MTITVDDIRSLYATQRLDSEIQPFIDTAMIIVDEDLIPLGKLSVQRLDMISKYLTIHFMSLSDEQVENGSVSGNVLKRSKLGESDESFDAGNPKAFGLTTSRWGQTAIALDNTGTLSNLNNNQILKAQFRVV